MRPKQIGPLRISKNILRKYCVLQNMQYGFENKSDLGRRPQVEIFQCLESYKQKEEFGTKSFTLSLNTLFERKKNRKAGNK